MDLRLLVGGLLTRNTVLSTLLMNYAERLKRGRAGHGTTTASCFIRPTWRIEEDRSAEIARHLLIVEAHAARTDPRHEENLDTILRLLDVVLTDEHASAAITARRLETAAGGGLGGRSTAVRVGMWEIAPVPSHAARATQPRLLPWPDCSTALTAGDLAPGITSLN
jgi:hypothetical protein